MDHRKLEKYYKRFLRKIRKIPNNKYDDYLIPKLTDVIECNKSATKNRPHKTVKLFYNGSYVDIDANISELLNEIWIADIYTSNSCENNNPKDYIWIEFTSANDLEKFLEIMFINRKMKNVDDRITNHYFMPGAWRLDMNMCFFNMADFEDSDNSSISEMTDDQYTIDIIDIGYSLRFPMSDYKWVLNRMKKYNERQIQIQKKNSSSKTT